MAEMPFPTVTLLLQTVNHQRGQRPEGKRILSDGTYQVTASDNPPPGPNDLLEKDRSLNWETVGVLSEAQLGAIRDGIRSSGILDLPPRILINYCKEDPGTQIWTILLDGQPHRIVLYDPKPRRAAEIDVLLGTLAEVLRA